MLNIIASISSYILNQALIVSESVMNKKACSAHWIVKLAKNSSIPSVNNKPFYLTMDEATPFFDHYQCKYGLES
jgi:hypothetical protein